MICFFLAAGAAVEAAPTAKKYVGPVVEPQAFEQIPAKPVSEKAGAGKKTTVLPGGRIKMSGRYRLSMGIDRDQDFVLNEAHGDLQERNFRYAFGEYRENTFDPMIYQKFELMTDFSPADKWNFHTKLVADPWSWVGTTGEQVQSADTNAAIIMRYNLKYFGAYNSTLNETFRNNIADLYSFPLIKVHDGRTTRTTVMGFADFDGVPGGDGIPFTIPELEIDYEFRPVREFWVDYTEDLWQLRLFALAGESQALFTDDPLELSNHKDFWQQSPWLYDYKPVMFFTDGSIRRGHYDDALSFTAKDSDGNRMILLKGASLTADDGRTSVAATVAAPQTPWDEKYFAPNNLPGAARVKHWVNDAWMLGGTYTFRSGLVDNSMADFNQVAAVDTSYQLSPDTVVKAEFAGSGRSQDLLTNELIDADKEGYASRLIVEKKYDHNLYDGTTDLHLSFTHMDQDFEPLLSRYSNTRYDRFWAKHLTFESRHPSLEVFRFGDGIDTNRLVWRARWKEKLFKERFENWFDLRQVNKASNTAYTETVINNEAVFRYSPQTTWKFYFRWQGLPDTTQSIEPLQSNLYYLSNYDPVIETYQNTAIRPDLNPDRFTYAVAVQHVFSKELTAEGFFELSNDIPDFPRGVINNTFRDANDRVDGLLIDRLQPFIYNQAPFGLPPYDYFSITKVRLIWKPEERLTYTFHGAYNDHLYASGIDDNITHIGLSMKLDYNDKLSFFGDYTYSKTIDLARMVATSLDEQVYEGHHNVYFSADYQIRPDTVLRGEYGMFGLGSATPIVTPYAVTTFTLPTLDTEHLFRLTLTGEF